MKKLHFTAHLRATANELTPFTKSSGTSTWNGVEYIKTSEVEEPDPYALLWWANLLTIASLIEAQGSPVTTQQIEYLKTTLFGGMGSFNDLVFDPRTKGDIANTINNRLDQQRRILFQSFSELAT